MDKNMNGRKLFSIGTYWELIKIYASRQWSLGFTNIIFKLIITLCKIC